LVDPVSLLELGYFLFSIGLIGAKVHMISPLRWINTIFTSETKSFRFVVEDILSTMNKPRDDLVGLDNSFCHHTVGRVRGFKLLVGVDLGWVIRLYLVAMLS
jgi:hypothetical protein